MVSVQRILAIAIGCIVSQKLSLFHFAPENCPDIFRKFLRIPFIDQTVDLPCFFVPPKGRIHMIHYRNKANTPPGKPFMEAAFRRHSISGKTGLGLAENDRKTPIFRIGQHPLKSRSVLPQAGIILIGIDVIHCPPLPFCIFQKQRPLILNAFTFCHASVCILHRKSAIDRHSFLFHGFHSFSL